MERWCCLHIQSVNFTPLVRHSNLRHAKTYKLMERAGLCQFARIVMTDETSWTWRYKDLEEGKSFGYMGKASPTQFQDMLPVWWTT